MTEPILLVGGGGHARACIDVIEQGRRFRIAGLVDRPEMRGAGVLGYPVLGCDDDLPALLAQYPRVLVSVGQIGAPTVRRRLFEHLCTLGAELPAVVSPHAVLSAHSRLGDGVLVGHGAIVQAAAAIGENAIINSRALVEHDARIGAHCHVATAAVVNGGVVIEENCFIGSGAILREGVRIGAGSFIGAGSLVTRDCPAASQVRRKA